MPRFRPDPSFYPSPRDAMAAPPEELAYVAMIDPAKRRPDAVGVVDVDPASPGYGRLVGRVDMPSPGDELHHFGWNACSSHLCPYAPHPHADRRYLIVPGIHSSRIHILDTRPDPRKPEIVKVIEGRELARKTGYAAPHTAHCGPDGIYVNALGAPDGQGPGGIFMLDHETFDLVGPWELDRGPQYLAYDFWWHLGHDAMITSEWGTPAMLAGGLDAEMLRAGRYGKRLHVWDLRRRRHAQVLSLDDGCQMPLELRPAHDPRRAYGFVGCVLSLEDLSGSVWLWYRMSGRGNGGSDRYGDADRWALRKVIDIPAEPADPAELPPFLREFGVVPPLVTDLSLTLDDRTLYVSCWGTGDLLRYDVSRAFRPRLTGRVRLGGIASRAPHPADPGRPLNGGPQMVEVSRDGERVYLTNSLYSPVDAQLYPDGIEGWMVKLDAGPDGGLRADPDFLLRFGGGFRGHQVRLQGGDASSDSFCYS